MMLRTQGSFHAAARRFTLAAMIGGTLALGTLRDALVYAPNGADADLGSPRAATTAPARER
jgi:hypothetical protein